MIFLINKLNTGDKFVRTLCKNCPENYRYNKILFYLH